MSNSDQGGAGAVEEINEAFDTLTRDDVVLQRWESFILTTGTVDCKQTGLRHVFLIGIRTRNGGTLEKKNVVGFEITRDIQVSSVSTILVLRVDDGDDGLMKLELEFSDIPSMERVKAKLVEWIRIEGADFNKSLSDDSFKSEKSLELSPEEQLLPLPPGDGIMEEDTD